MTDPHSSFDAAFTAHGPRLTCRPRDASDAAFLTDLSIACSPVAGMVPAPMLLQQAEFQHAAHDGAHPRAMQRIAMLDGEPVGRIMIDWDTTESHCVDIAVLPGHQGKGVGLALLRTWLDVADQRGQPAQLEVRQDNPAARIYLRLGFHPVPDPHGWSPVVTMLRPVG
jgi:ribosomal protein S18 acetylase RimI-like enzyme